MSATQQAAGNRPLEIEIFGSSETSFGEAGQIAVATACQSLRHVDWFQVTEMRGLVENDNVKAFQVTAIFGFRLEDQPSYRLS